MSDELAQPLIYSSTELAIRDLNKLREWYSSQEVYWHKKLWGSADNGGEGWSQSGESEWMRYRKESAALRTGIIALGGEPDDSAYSDSEEAQHG